MNKSTTTHECEICGTDDDEYGLMYEDDPITGKTLTDIGALVPWLVTIVVLTPLFVAMGLSVLTALMFTPWLGFIASIAWIEMHY